MLGHDGDLVAIHTQDFTLKVDQLSLTHFHVISCLEIVLTFLTCINKTFVNNFAKNACMEGLRNTLVKKLKKQTKNGFTVCMHLPVVSVTTSRSIPSGWSSNFSSSDRVGLTPSVIYAKKDMIYQ